MGFLPIAYLVMRCQAVCGGNESHMFRPWPELQTVLTLSNISADFEALESVKYTP